MTRKDKALEGIDNKKYQQVLAAVREQINLTQDEIFKTVTRKKVEMAWQIGRIVDSAIPKKRKKEYGQQLVERLEKDTAISRSVLYKMRSFYQTYPTLPADDPRLNWSHYRVLSGVKAKNKRQLLEDLAKENSWNSDELQAKASFAKGGGTRSVTEDSELASPKSSGATRQLLLQRRQIKPDRGKIFTYKITQIAGTDKQLIDCGFKIFREAEEKLPQDAKVVLVSKKNGKYKFKKSAAKEREVYLYKAYLKRIVDGDTIHANIDLGFGMWHEENLRLAKINAAEADTAEGKKATVEITKLLTAAPFFIIKSIKTDMYNRYVADIFLPKENETDLQKIADKGIYLNQLLLDRGLAEVF